MFSSIFTKTSIKRKLKTIKTSWSKMCCRKLGLSCRACYSTTSQKHSEPKGWLFWRDLLMLDLNPVDQRWKELKRSVWRGSLQSWGCWQYLWTGAGVSGWYRNHFNIIINYKNQTLHKGYHPFCQDQLHLFTFLILLNHIAKAMTCFYLMGYLFPSLLL